MEALEDVRLSEELTKKLVDVGCDGENVMVGRREEFCISYSFATPLYHSELFCPSSQAYV